ncbi:HAD hydrolase, family IIID [Kwoniella pini CBS 10737]|uniref:protein-serine/threonine phosphatase n=1 Tax=Kwoniella pini CBS 10737 TaxID=1296096 RepID=A0A1B9I7M0_9TREE|nr:HAD hydrolase, family IIID [Kwoniella pini CBS 10737]OCF51518.1 HAD hydrolase, family IIID [Kwoniella pini CBS 10737]
MTTSQSSEEVEIDSQEIAMEDDIDKPVIAIPDIESTENNKKKKLYHSELNEEIKEDDKLNFKENSNEEKDSQNELSSISNDLQIDVEPPTPESSSSSFQIRNNDNDNDNESSSSSSTSLIPLEEELNEQEQEEEENSKILEAVPLSETLEQQEEWWELKMTWSGKVFELKVAGNDMVYDFRDRISQLTGVPPDGQKLINLLPGSKGKLSAEHDATRFGTLGIKKGTKFIMIGTRKEDRFLGKGEFANELTDNFDVKYSKSAPGLHHADDPRNKRKISEICEKIPITVMNEPRKGKKLLVLDLDYTIVDTKPLISGALPSLECARPGLHEFLEAVYPHYDIVIWSQTHWRWLESKLVELDMIGGSRNYKVSFVSDKTTMFPVWSQRNGKPYQHEVKPLAYFWNTFSHWSAKNTIHIDDLSRNFALNPGEGLKIRAFNKAGQAEGMADKELIKLGKYLLDIAKTVEDFTTLDHNKWKLKIQSAKSGNPSVNPNPSNPANPPQ